jgi:hypothetical protein
MKLEVPVRNEDGSLAFTAIMNEKEVQAVLQFGLNMATAMGITSQLLSPENIVVEVDEGASIQ